MKTCSTLCRAASQGLLAGILAWIVTLPAAAQTAATTTPTGAHDAGWHFLATGYLWTPALHAQTVRGDDLDMSISDVVSNLDAALMGGIQAHHGRLSLNLDMVYAGLSEEVDTTANLLGRPVSAEADVDLELLVPTAYVGYAVVCASAFELEVLAGARYARVETDIDFTVNGPGPLVLDRSRSESSDIVDGIAGVRGQVLIGERWFMPFYLDAGAGDSSFTWQAFAGVGFRVTRNVDLTAGYRHLYWDLDDSKVLDDLALSGPLAGVRYRF